jgi:hypothetical protein
MWGSSVGVPERLIGREKLNDGRGSAATDDSDATDGERCMLFMLMLGEKVPLADDIFRGGSE